MAENIDVRNSDEKENKTGFRDQVAEEFVRALETDPISWVKGWFVEKQENLSTGSGYRGLNQIWLRTRAKKLGFNDPRWATFNQIKKLGYHLKKGSKGCKVEYWMPYDVKNKKAVTWEVYNSALSEHLSSAKNGGNAENFDFKIVARFYTVFNGEQIEGVPPYEAPCYEVSESEVVQRISEGMKVPVIEENNDGQAYYSLTQDEVHLPPRTLFYGDGEYQATALHELGHATGHKSRLDRDLSGRFGSESYAYEELVAEITSAFMAEYAPSLAEDTLLKNHIAYVQSWADGIKKDKNVLFKAIKEAEKARDYLVMAGKLELLENKKEKTGEKEKNKKPSIGLAI